MSWDEQVGARTLYGECRGEPIEGQRAVAHVLFNRLRDGRWGKNLAAVCMAKLQFSCWNATDPQREKMAALSDDDETLQHLFGVLGEARDDPASDPTNGALYYFSDTIKQPSWADKMKFLVKIAHHSFFTDR